MLLVVVFTFGILLGSFLAVTLLVLRRRNEKHVNVVVLGDIGRSPRVQNHCLSLARHGFTVNFVGYPGSIPRRDVISNAKIQLALLHEVPSFVYNFPRLVIYFIKVLWQSADLFIVLISSCKKGSHLLLQNPPAIPSLAVCWFYCVIHGTKFVVDWHNYGYTILSLNLSPSHPLVHFGKWYEHFLGKLASDNICVTNAMKKDLALNWNIKAHTMYDRPPDMFKKSDLESQHNLYLKLAKKYSQFKASGQDGSLCTAFTRKGGDDDPVILLPQRPALLVSSTSWTEDEDFSILLSALEDYENCKRAGAPIPNLLCAITGKGPLKEYYCEQIEQKDWKFISVCTPWLEAEDYPVLLGSADIGVCLHKSSSGLDLPMKVVDMFGCGLPVCAIHFKCLDELVKHNVNGMVFHTEEELSLQLQDLLRGFPKSCNKLEEFQKNLREFQELRWNEAWDHDVKPLFTT